MLHKLGQWQQSTQTYPNAMDCIILVYHKNIDLVILVIFQKGGDFPLIWIMIMVNIYRPLRK